MKIRNGFVSNSSSSSFVVGFPTIPRTKEKMKSFLFPDGDEFYPSPFEDRRWSNDTVAETVFNDMAGKMPLSSDEFVKATADNAEINYNSKKYEMIDTRDDGSTYKTTDWDKLEEDRLKLSKKNADKFLKENNDYYYFEFAYADEDGDYGCDLEHGDLFKALPHMRMSHH